jgi:hypothetical protein
MSEDRSLLFKRQLLDDVWEEIASLKGKELDDYLVSLGLSPDDLLQKYEKALVATCDAPKRALFGEARRRVRQNRVADVSKIISFDLAKKKEIMAAIKKHAATTNNMTLAARNQTIEDEGDLDSFLEACLRLGVIDTEGNVQE